MGNRKRQSRLKNTRDTATDFFGKSERWLWENTAPRGSIPCVRFGKSVLYDWEALERLIAELSARLEVSHMVQSAATADYQQELLPRTAPTSDVPRIGDAMTGIRNRDAIDGADQRLDKTGDDIEPNDPTRQA